MATFSEVQITFNSDILNTKTVNFKDTYGVEIQYLETYVPSRTGANEVTIGVPTATPGEVSAINYVIAFNLDYNTGGEFEVTQLLNTVTIKAIDSNATFSAAPHSGDVVFSYTNVNLPDYNRVSARSPYFVTSPIYNGVDTVTPTSVEFKLYVWSGDLITDKPLEPNYTYNKQPEYLNKEFIYMDVAPQIRGFINNNYTGAYDDDLSVWFHVDTVTTYATGTIEASETRLAFYGYGDRLENTNPIPSKDIMINNNYISVLSGDDVIIPFYKGGDSYSVVLRNDTTVIDTKTVTGLNITDTLDSVEVLEFSTAFECNNILVQNTTDLTEFVLDLELITECIYEPIKGTFVNKQGVFQDFYFYKVSSESMKVTSDDYRANVLTESIVNNVPTITYSTAKHGTKTTNSQGKTEIEVNTGFINEDNNTLIKEMLLSESIWLTINNVITPVNLKSKSVNYMTKRNDQLIKYKFKFEYSYNEVQDIV